MIKDASVDQNVSIFKKGLRFICKGNFQLVLNQEEVYGAKPKIQVDGDD